jgi:predicted RNA-binding protein YlxR (DUF448 family)
MGVLSFQILPRPQKFNTYIIFARTWQIRRIVITKETLSFALLDDDSEIDFIPLSEVICVEEMCGVEEANADGTTRKNCSGLNMLQRSMGSEEIDQQFEEDSTSRLFVNAFQIATISDGYNSGRSYYLQADSSDVKQKVIEQLQALSQSARKRAEVKSLFRKFQDHVRQVYTTRIFQGSAALLIIAVSESDWVGRASINS